MLKILFSILLIPFLQTNSIAQIDTGKLNLRFKTMHNNTPIGWKASGDKMNIIHVEKKLPDSAVLVIKNFTSENEEGGILSLRIPHNLAGKKLTFLADIKTDSIVTNGAAGLYINVSPKVAFNNLEDLKLNGTSGWNKYGITVKLSPKETKSIEIGLYLLGKGQAKFKNLQLLVDDVDISNASIYKPKIESDTIYNFNSHVLAFEITEERVNRLKITGQIWGLLKYFHPEVATGKWDMDVELFKFLPSVLECQSENDFERKLLAWMDNFGNYSKSTIKDTIGSQEIKLSADYSWIDKTRYSQTLKQRIKDLTQAKRADKNVYVEYFDGPNQVSIKELNYSSISKSDVGFRLLGLFRYWNIIQYYYPYRYLLNESWDTQLDTFIPRFIKSKTASELDSSYLNLISKINDTHSFAILSDHYNSEVFGKKTVEFKTKIIDDQLIISSLGTNSLNKKIKAGDIIKTINGINSSEKIKSIRPFISASNETVALRDIAPRLLQTNADSLNITIDRDGENLSLFVPTRRHGSSKSIAKDKRSYYLLKDSVVYLNVGEFVDEDFKEFNLLLERSKALIIDYRYYPKTYLHQLFAKHLYRKKTQYAKFSTNKGFAPGEFRFTGTASVGKQQEDLYKGKVVVLINEDTQSAAEYQVMAIRQSPIVTIVGSTTAGADGNVSWVPLPFGYKTLFSGIGVYYPDGTETQGVGIVPDVAVKLALDDIKNNHDPYLLKALEIINLGSRK